MAAQSRDVMLRDMTEHARPTPSQPSSPAAPDRWLDLLSRHPRATVCASVLPSAGLKLVTPELTSTLHGVGLLALALAFAIRLVTHVFAGYLTSLRLGALTILSAILPAGFAFAGIAVLDDLDPWLEALAMLGLFGGVVLISSAMVDVIVASNGRYERASDVIPEWRAVKVLRRLLRRAEIVPLIRRLDDLFGAHTERKYVSGFVALTAAIVLMMAGTFAAEAVVTGSSDRTEQTPPRAPPSRAHPASRRSTPPRPRTTSSPPPVAIATPVSSTSVTYEDLCGTAFVPGEPAPAPQADALHALWLGGPGRLGAGAFEAGCAQPATEVDGGRGVWIARGTCGAELRSLGVATADGSAALLLQQAARFASREAQAGRLVGASDRIQVELGDLYVVTTVAGTYVLVRQRASAGSIDRRQPRRSCGEPTSENVRYTVLPPALAGLWLGLLRERWVWPAVDRSRQAPGTSFVFFADGVRQQVLARATCRGPLHCVLQAGGTTIASDGSAYVSAEEIRSLAP
jgi:hypothetical protein